jgi:hypothetical protein
MKNLLATIFILISLQAFSQSQYYIGSKYILWDGHLIQIDSARNGTWKVLASRNWVQDYVNTHGGNGYTNGYGLNLSSNIFSVDTTTIAYKTWAAARSTLMSAGYGLTGGGSLSANRTFVVDSALLAQYFIRRKDSLPSGYYPYSNPSAFLQSINSLVIAGSNVNISGLGTYASPLVISSTAAGTGGGASNVNLGSGYRWAFPNTNNIRTYFTGLWLTTDSTTNSNAITTKADSASMATYFVRRKDSTTGGYYPYASNPLNYTTAAAIAGIYVPLTRLVNTGYGLTGGGALSGNLTLKVDTSTIMYQLPTAAMLFVEKNGSDATGVRGRQDKPFLTIRGALNASSSGDQIVVYPGTYTEASPISLAHNVNFHFLGKGIVQLNTSVSAGAVFTDSTTVSTSVITAQGWTINAQSSQNALKSTAASNITIFADQIVSASGNTIDLSGSTDVKVTANRIAGNSIFIGTINLNQAHSFYADAKLIETGAFGIGINDDRTHSVIINADRIYVADSTNDDYLLMINNSNATDSIFITANEIHAGLEWALWGKGNSHSIHVKAQHISTKSDCVVVSGTNPGGAVYVDADVIENRTTGAMDGIIHGEGGTIVVSRATVIRNPLATGGDIKTSIFGGDTGYVKLIAVSFDPTHINEVPSGTVSRIDNYFHSGIKLNGLSASTTAPFALGYDSSSKQVYTMANPLKGSLVVPLTDAVTIATDASLGFTIGATYRVTLGGSRTIANPTNLTDGQRITYELHQDGTGGRTVSWGAMFTWSTDLPVPTLSTNINYVDQVAFVYNASAGKLYVSGYNLGIH